MTSVALAIVNVVILLYANVDSCRAEKDCISHTQHTCPFGWKIWGDSCYVITRDLLNWQDAQGKCRQLGGEMAAPRSQQEDEFFASIMVEVDVIWIACDDIETEGDWICNNDSGYRNWFTNQPDNINVGQHCVVIASNFENQWDDDHCWLSFPTVCRRPVSSVVHLRPLLRPWRLLISCLIGHVFAEFPTNSINHCAWLCSENSGCRSFNVMHYGGPAREKNCQLNNANHYGTEADKFGKAEQGFCVYGE